MKFGLRNIRQLLKSVGNPQTRFPCIHIAGTNGKGSTAAFLASICMEAGYRTALYTSPHLVKFSERIRVNGGEIPEKRLVSYVGRLRPIIERVHATFFEATTCIAFQYFADEKVEIAIVEAGLGGRLDSTNVVVPIASVITNIGLDHTDILGRTIRAIAKEKGGIIKHEVPCITGSEDGIVLETLRNIAQKRRTTLIQARRLVEYDSHQMRTKLVSFHSRSFSVRDVELGLEGKHQLHNARLAVATLDVLRRDTDSRKFIRLVNNAAVRSGLMRVVRNAGIRGRMEKVGRSSEIILDVAHNPQGIETLADSLRENHNRPFTVVFGVMKDKDFASMIDGIAPVAGKIIAVAAEGKRALPAKSLYGKIRRRKLPGRLGGSVANGLRMAKELGEPILVTGSHYVVGEAIKYLGRKKA